ncbi:DUF4386 domain-containing protein [Hymenobacter sp. BT770]|uniref:DUF4386 domain-containing protein n=1 Tax=Hymenobacter sp. BT770 TaxID=2886942 RepID=UPI001D12F35D|nr:DUF4386 domain-containing protein [Hymenobacter sp. BT770]MCC3152533.1 DUF4386 domain-containing protein [Hymenobacter sp. BT770]MDO3414490.1 DUF4386 domain-containing protein [Hymenobacter sp. BT770]
METTLLKEPVTEMSPRLKARIGAGFYILTILTGILAQGFISGRLVVADDAAATAHNILTHESLYRAGFAVYLIEMACQITMTVIFYDLLKPVNRSMSLLAAVFSLVGCTIKILARLFYFAPLLLLGGRHYLQGFSPQQLPGLSLLMLKINDYGAAIALIFFGIHALLKGYLIIKSWFLPSWLGVVSVLGGAGWLLFLWPPLGYQMFPVIAILGLIGSIANIGWLLVFGVDEPRWKEQARASQASIWR